MGLRETAERDLGRILENRDEWGWDITLTDPSGTSAPLVGLSYDISQSVDPDTGQLITGRFAHVVLRVSSILLAGLAIPENVADSSQKPWLVAFNDIQGTPYTFKVSHASPDRTLGSVSCTLEGYAP